MTAVLTPFIAPAQTGGLTVGLRQTGAFTKRSLLGRLRQPASLAPSFVFPLFFAALSSSYPYRYFIFKNLYSILSST